jgi:hypothetical protein
MEREQLATEKFVGKIFGSAVINDIIGQYRLPPEKLQQMIITCMREMGIFVIQPQHQTYFHKFVVDRLKNDPQIIHMSHMAKMREATRTRSRHNE